MKVAASIRMYLAHNMQVALNSLGRLYRTPLASVMTAAVLGIAMALPAGLYLLTGNIQRLASQWDGDANISLFLHPGTSEQQANRLSERLREWPEIGALQLITAQQALDEFQRLSGFGDILDSLEENPLPTVLSLSPAGNTADTLAIEQLVQRLQALEEVELAQLDLQWVKRFNAIVSIVRRSIWVLAALLGLAVLLIIGNTIRLEIQNRRDEIEITKLIGATDRFIRRPFLYCGLWYGLTGAVIASILVQLALWQLKSPVAELAGLYQSDFVLRSLGLIDTLGLLAGGVALGLLGAWLAVGRHLAAIEPT